MKLLETKYLRNQTIKTFETVNGKLEVTQTFVRNEKVVHSGGFASPVTNVDIHLTRLNKGQKTSVKIEELSLDDLIEVSGHIGGTAAAAK